MIELRPFINALNDTSTVNEAITRYEKALGKEPRWALVSFKCTPAEIALIPETISVCMNGGVLRGELWLSEDKPRGAIHRE